MTSGKYKSIFLFLLLALPFQGCTLFSKNTVSEASRVKAPSKEAIVIESQISRRDLKLALGNELKTSKMRAVEVFQNASGISQNFPSFRLFDIEEGSVYHLLGLVNADILVAINEHALISSQVIGPIVRLLPKEAGVTFEVIREGKSLLLKIKFIN